MTWAEANGRLNTANTQGWNIASKAMNTGCYAYKGKSGKDEFGSWRVPSDRELSMILIFAHELESEKYASKLISNSYTKLRQQHIIKDIGVPQNKVLLQAR